MNSLERLAKHLAATLLLLLALTAVASAALDIFLPNDMPRRSIRWQTEEPATVVAETSDGLTLQGLFWSGRNDPDHLIVFFHGTRGHVVKAAKYVEDLRDLGAAILVADYRGYSSNPGTPDEAGLVRDGKAFMELARTLGFAPEKTIMIGHSLGTGVVMHLAETEPAAGMILLSAFTKIDDLLPKSVAKRYPEEFDNISRVEHLVLPKIFVQGTFDALVPPDHARRLYLKAAAPAALVVLPVVFHLPPISRIKQVVAIAFDAFATGDLTMLKRAQRNGVMIWASPDRDVPELPSGMAGNRQ